MNRFTRWKLVHEYVVMYYHRRKRNVLTWPTLDKRLRDKGKSCLLLLKFTSDISLTISI